MKKIESFFVAQENLIYRADKSAKVVWGGFLFVFGIAGLPSICRVIIAIVMGNITTSFGLDLFIAAFTFLVGWSIPLIGVIQHISGEIVVTNRRIFISHGITGKLVIIPFESIAGIEKRDYRITTYYLLVHLLDGKVLQSDFNYSKEGLNSVVKILADKGIKVIDFFKMKYEKYRKPMPDEILYQKYSINPLLPITVITLFIIPIVLFTVYFMFFN